MRTSFVMNESWFVARTQEDFLSFEWLWLACKDSSAIRLKARFPLRHAEGKALRNDQIFAEKAFSLSTILCTQSDRAS